MRLNKMEEWQYLFPNQEKEELFRLPSPKPLLEVSANIDDY
jgi:hypothetical protein